MSLFNFKNKKKYTDGLLNHDYRFGLIDNLKVWFCTTFGHRISKDRNYEICGRCGLCYDEIYHKQKRSSKITALCVNNSNKPKEIPDDLWLELGQEYTVKSMYFVNSFVLCVELEEIDLVSQNIVSESTNLPITGFGGNRFNFIGEDIENNVVNMIKNSKIPETKQSLELQLEIAIKEDRFEDAVILRDKISKIV